MAERSPAQPVAAVRFTVRIGAREIAVAQVSPPQLGSDPATVTQSPPNARGRVRWSAEPQPPRLVLTRAVDGDRTLYEWRRAAVDGRPAARDVVVTLLDPVEGAPKAAWRFRQAWPTCWTGPALDANAADLAWEQLELVCTDVEWI